MYDSLQVQIEKAQADLRVAQEACLAALAQLHERYHELWASWARAGGYANEELLRTTVRESGAIMDEIDRVAELVQRTRPDTDTFNRLRAAIRLDGGREEALNS